MKALRYAQQMNVVRMYDDGSIEIALPAVGNFDGFRFTATLTEREAAQRSVGRKLLNDTRVAEYLAMQELARRGIEEVG